MIIWAKQRRVMRKARRLCPVCERVPDGALGGTAGWCAVYRSMELRYINLSINELSIFFVIDRAVSWKIIPVREKPLGI